VKTTYRLANVLLTLFINFLIEKLVSYGNTVYSNYQILARAKFAAGLVWRLAVNDISSMFILPSHKFCQKLAMSDNN